MAEIGVKWLPMVGNGWKWLEKLEWLKWLDMALHDWVWLECLEIAVDGCKCLEWL